MAVAKKIAVLEHGIDTVSNDKLILENVFKVLFPKNNNSRTSHF